MYITMNDLAKYLISFTKNTLLSKESFEEMTKAQWNYDGSNGDTLDDTVLSYGIGCHIATGKKGKDVVLKEDMVMKGHTGFAYGLASDMFYGEKVGFVSAITGSGKGY